MSAWTATAGSATVWLLLVVLGLGAGYALVLGWGRWGGRLPTPAAAVVGRVLGPVDAVPPQMQASAAWTETAEDAAPAAAAAPPADTVRQVVKVAPPAGGSADGPAIAALPTNDTAEDPGVAPPEDAPPAAMDDAPGAEPNVPEPEDARRLDRAEALEELTTLLDLDYEDAAALLRHGLWGCENFDEWQRSMRAHTPPEDVAAAAWQAVIQAAWSDLEPRVAAHRKKRAATQRLEALWGVGPEQAEALYAAGYEEVAALRKASTDSLAKIPGIGAARAFQIRAAAHGLAPTP